MELIETKNYDELSRVAAGAAHGAGFANAVRRHIILMHITLACFIAYAVQCLSILKGAERGYGHNLGLAAGEHGAARAAYYAYGLAGLPFSYTWRNIMMLSGYRTGALP